jgi:hypothetical protein
MKKIDSVFLGTDAPNEIKGFGCVEMDYGCFSNVMYVP